MLLKLISCKCYKTNNCRTEINCNFNHEPIHFTIEKQNSLSNYQNINNYIPQQHPTMTSQLKEKNNITYPYLNAVNNEASQSHPKNFNTNQQPANQMEKIINHQNFMPF